MKLIGRGAFGSVFLVKINNINYALKRSTSNYDQEINFLKLFNSNNIIKIIDHYYENEYYDIILEYADGGDLNKFIKKKIKLPNIEFKFLLKNILNGINYIHSFNIIHHDIKPGNILICNKIPKICDFNSAIKKKDIKNNELIGSLYYLAPEVVNGIDYDEKIDYWAFGCVIYELLTFTFAFEDKSLYNLYFKIDNVNYNLKIVDKKFKKLVKKILTKNVKKRYSYLKINKFLEKKFLNKN